MTAVHITELGKVYTFNDTTKKWVNQGQLLFTRFEFPKNLNVFADGFYTLSGNEGIITKGVLGSPAFDSFSGIITNPEPYYVDVDLEIVSPTTAPVNYSFENLMPGNLNIIQVDYTGKGIEPVDNSPTVQQIEVISGTTFSVAFKAFLTSKNLATLQEITKAGPIRYITGFPTPEVDPNELALLQSHVDLYSINNDATQNQHFIDLKYRSMFDIANTPKNIFVDEVVNGTLLIFRAAQIHEIAVQNQKLVGNMLSGLMGDLRLTDGAIPAVQGSDFISANLAKVVNSCGCNDCKSNISPFAYMMDLIKYAAARVDHVNPIYSHNGNTVPEFIEIISDKFLQPFGTLNVDCETLHNEFCRVRLVTEVLEKWVTLETAAGHITTMRLTVLADERKQYLLLVYRTILTQAGTSFEELRDVIVTNPLSEKEKRAKKLCDKLGVPLYIPGTSELIVNRLWLTFNGGTPPEKELTAVNLEEIFGFRNTQRDVITNTPESLMDEWRAAFLRDVWKLQDYPLSDYSREGVVPGNAASYKANWKPIIDPDIIGYADMTYLFDSDVPMSIFTRALWARRKADTDAFLSYCVGDNSNVSRTSADIAKRILKVADKNIVGDVIENNKIQIKDSVTPFNWITFDVINRKLVQTDTDVILAKPLPAMFQPDGSQPTMRYKQVLNVLNIAGTVSITLTWPDAVIKNQLIGGYAKLESDGVGSNSPYETNSSGSHLIASVSFVNENEVHLVLGAGASLNAAFLSGNINFVYEVEVSLHTDLLLNPEKVVAEMFGTTQEYTLLPPAPSGTTSPFEYMVWIDPVSWPSPINPTFSKYEKLKQLYQLILSDNASAELLLIVSDNLHMDTAAFNRMMQLMILCENYLASMYTAKRPTESELYELASIIRNSAKTPLREIWIVEEIEHQLIQSAGIANTRLDGRYFWKSLSEPVRGAWDPSLQTIPENVLDITAFSVPIIDPELLSKNDMLQSPDTIMYRSLYDDRKEELDDVYTEYLGRIPGNDMAFVEMLNVINTGDTDTPYDILPYLTLEALTSDLNSNDAFRVKEASDVLWEAFRMNKEDFNAYADIKSAYENIDPLLTPSNVEIEKAVKLFVSAYKRKQLYTNEGVSTGWINNEIEGNFPDGVSVKYYNVIKMFLAPGRTDVSDRIDWQNTLKAWNRMPAIQPDIVPPENIKSISSSNWVYTTWTARRASLANDFDTISNLFHSGTNAGILLFNLKNFLNLCIARVSYNVTTLPLDYVQYFTELTDKENNGEDIRPFLDQFGISVTEYRFLIKVYNLLENEVPSVPSTLLDSECKDVADILIHIQSTNVTFFSVLEEYNNDLILDQDYFRIFEPAPISFPLTDLPKYNQWRSPYPERKAWLDILETRIELEENVIEKWKEVLAEAEDRNMPLMRDALIKALTKNCEGWQDAAERLAKTFFIETKDNCCVKHTRVSFAIETLQGLLFALENGIYDDFVEDFTLIAPDFKREWEWIGSYNTWRAAMFVFLYPENLLYPTLKRKQSPKFIELANKISTANRLSPEDACKLGNEYESYLQDIENLEMICATNTYAEMYSYTIDSCCGGSNSQREYVSYYIGQSTISKKVYYSVKRLGDPKFTHSFWEEIPLPQNTKVVGCQTMYEKYLGDPVVYNSALWLFYTVMDKGILKMAYFTKDISDAKSIWIPGQEIELPIFQTPYNTNVYAKKVVLCQASNDWNDLTFAISYQEHPVFSSFIRFANYNKAENVLSLLMHQVSGGYYLGMDHYSTYITSIKMIIVTQFQTISMRNCIIGVTTGKITITSPEIQDNNAISLNPAYNNRFIAAFENKPENNTIIVISEHITSGVQSAEKISIGYSNGVLSTFRISLSPNTLPPVQTVYPLYTIAYPNYFAIKVKNFAVSSSCTIDTPTYTEIRSADHFALIPNKIDTINVESAECITDMGIRTAGIKSKLRANLNSPQGTASPYAPSTDSIRELLYEAYYYVPMLLALDQQKRGQFDSALSWYRSVYDYTNEITSNRKIFYGLVLEQSITNSFLQTSNWLLDPLNPHQVAQTRTNAYTKYTVMNIIQCMFAYADREFTLDTIETIPVARKLYTTALDLLKIPELNIKVNGCLASAIDCLDSQTEMSTERSWVNLYDELKKDLASIGDEKIIEDIVGEIAQLLNTGDETTYPEKFDAAFELIKDSKPIPPIVQNVTEVLVDFGDRVNEAYQYLSAINSTESFNVEVGNNYANTVASISGKTIESLSSDTNLTWLTEEVPSNKLPYEFNFATKDGKQFLTSDLAYNPLRPTPVSYSANLNYNNAVSIIGEYQTGMPISYTPLIDFKFCMPQNPVYQSMTLKGNLELYKIWNCRNIAGITRDLSAYAAETDTTSGISTIGANGNLLTPGINTYTPSQYRFRVLIERAKQIASQAQQMESLFLAALEKEDAANYDQLRARQDLQTARATIKLQDLRITQANDEKGVADLQLDKVTFIETHYNSLIASGINDYERNSLDILLLAEEMQYLAAELSTASSIISFASMLTPGMTPANGISALAGGLGALASSSSSNAAALSTQSSIFASLASYQRREQEWQFQSQLAGFDITLANQQIKISEDGVRIATQEREIAVLNTTHAENTLEFLKTKFTNAELYNFMGNVLERSYSYMLNLTTAIARTAESQLYFERQEQAGPFILDDYWETPSNGLNASVGGSGVDRRGLTGSARLLVDITRLDQYAFDTAKRKLQMTKVISLSQNFPSEFQQFKETGVMYFELTNKLFDYDFPGHYLRLINGIKTTVVGLVPVYDQIKATLTADTTSYTVIGGTTFKKIPIRRAELDSVALTASNNATGLFELQPTQSEFLNPFEGMGIESRWEFKMPQFSNRIDYSNIADILVTVEYTALDSNQYRYQVLQDLDNEITFNRGFSMKNNFPDQWFELGEAESGTTEFGVNISLKREFFPQGIDDLKLNLAENLVLYFVREDGFEDEVDVLDFSKAVVPASANYAGGVTVNGKFDSTQLMGSIGTNPMVTLRLLFDNTITNRELFSEGKIKDILLLVPCKATLRSYPL
jgi:hypothetical protein